MITQSQDIENIPLCCIQILSRILSVTGYNKILNILPCDVQ